MKHKSCGWNDQTTVHMATCWSKNLVCKTSMPFNNDESFCALLFRHSNSCYGSMWANGSTISARHFNLRVHECTCVARRTWKLQIRSLKVQSAPFGIDRTHIYKSQTTMSYIFDCWAAPWEANFNCYSHVPNPWMDALAIYFTTRFGVVSIWGWHLITLGCRVLGRTLYSSLEPLVQKENKTDTASAPESR